MCPTALAMCLMVPVMCRMVPPILAIIVAGVTRILTVHLVGRIDMAQGCRARRAPEFSLTGRLTRRITGSQPARQLIAGRFQVQIASNTRLSRMRV